MSGFRISLVRLAAAVARATTNTARYFWPDRSKPDVHRLWVRVGENIAAT